jgi:ribosomal protein L37AE/L43A
VSARTSHWICGACGFRNRPRLNQDITKCEQCGETRDNENAEDVPPETR